MKVFRLSYNDEHWIKTIDYAKNSSWEAGKHLAELMENNQFSDWESVFIAMQNEEILGYCTFLKEDYFPQNRYSPWISTIFVDEKARGNRISQQMIEEVIEYAKQNGFEKVYLPSDIKGFYEKYDFRPIDTLKNYGGDMDTVFIREI